MLRMKGKKKYIVVLIVLIVVAATFILRDYETFSMEVMTIVDSNTQRVPVLLYHHILKEEENTNFKDNDSVISYNTFYNHMKYIKEHDIHTVTSRELYEHMYMDKELPEKSVVITFDDGYLSNHEYAYHIMKDFDMRGDIFLLTSEIQEHPLEFNPDFLPMLDWGRVGEMKDVFDFYSHTDALHKFVGDKPALTVLDHDSMMVDLNTSFEHEGIHRLAFAYPYGAYNDNTIRVLKEQDVSIAYTVEKGYVSKHSSPYELKRFVISPDVTMDDFKKIFERINID